MNAIRASWINGKIVLAEPANWPEGSELLVEPLAPGRAKIGLTEAEWRDDPEAIAAWLAAVEKIEPLVWAAGEREEYEQFRKKLRDFNIEAVRKQMDEIADGQGPIGRSGGWDDF